VRLEKRGVKVTIVDKTIGYELRCAAPIPFDAEYARDLGFAAVRHLLNGGNGDLITIQGGEFLPLPFAEVVDPSSGRGRRRAVDVHTESYHVARDYMVRLGPRWRRRAACRNRTSAHTSPAARCPCSAQQNRQHLSSVH
jgi:6-phosphofructokinase